MKTQEIYNNVLETRDFQHVSQYARRRQDGDLSHTQITAVIFAPKIAPKGIKLPPKRAAKWSIVRYPTKYKNLVTVEITRFFAFLLGAPAGISPNGDKLRLPGSDQKKISPPKGEGDFLVLQRGFPLPGINFDSPGATRKNLPAKRRGDFLVLQRGFEPRTPCLKGRCSAY